MAETPVPTSRSTRKRPRVNYNVYASFPNLDSDSDSDSGSASGSDLPHRHAHSKSAAQPFTDAKMSNLNHIAVIGSVAAVTTVGRTGTVESLSTSKSRSHTFQGSFASTRNDYADSGASDRGSINNSDSDSHQIEAVQEIPRVSESGTALAAAMKGNLNEQTDIERQQPLSDIRREAASPASDSTETLTYMNASTEIPSSLKVGQSFTKMPTTTTVLPQIPKTPNPTQTPSTLREAQDMVRNLQAQVNAQKEIQSVLLERERNHVYFIAAKDEIARLGHELEELKKENQRLREEDKQRHRGSAN